MHVVVAAEDGIEVGTDGSTDAVGVTAEHPGMC